MRKEQYTHVYHGIIGSLALLLIYFLLVGTLQGMPYAIGRLLELWYLMVPLVIGFGFQIGFFSCFRSSMKMSSKSTATSGGVSGVSMVACCAHHVTDMIPLIGMSALGLFLLQYQSSFLVLGIVSNVVGIMFMMNTAKKNNTKFKNAVFRSIMKNDLGKLVKFFSIFGILIVIASFVLATPLQLHENSSSGLNLTALSESKNSVTINVVPYPISYNEPVKFSISLNTHSVPLNYDLTTISTVIADGKEYSPINWDGSPPGGHHRNGIVTFPSISIIPKNLQLIIKGVAGTDWLFEWNV